MEKRDSSKKISHPLAQHADSIMRRRTKRVEGGSAERSSRRAWVLDPTPEERRYSGKGKQLISSCPRATRQKLEVYQNDC